jgi:signal transduction histidine kinase
MKQTVQIAAWSRRYQKALSRHLEKGSQDSLLPALKLGRQAVAMGLETLGLAAIHEQALKGLAAPNGSSGDKQRVVKRGKRFFAETLVPVERTRGTTLKTEAQVRQLAQTLQRSASEVSASAVHLERSITQRQAAEAALEKSDRSRSKLLKTSLCLQKEMRSKTHELLLAEERDRRKYSLQLKDEAAQTLLAIHLGLLALKTSACANTEKLEKEIANTQRLVRKSILKFERFTHEFARQK